MTDETTGGRADTSSIGGWRRLLALPFAIFGYYLGYICSFLLIYSAAAIVMLDASPPGPAMLAFYGVCFWLLQIFWSMERDNDG